MCGQRLDGLKIVGIRDVEELKRRALTSWRAVLFMARFVNVPPAAVTWARNHARKHQEAWDAYGRQNAAGGLGGAGSGAASVRGASGV